jgi:hypothetical protein
VVYETRPRPPHRHHHKRHHHDRYDRGRHGHHWDND